MTLHQIQSRKRAAQAARKPSPAPRAAAKRPAPAKRVTVGLLVGNRGFFPGHLAREGRDQMLAVLKDEGFDVVALGVDDTRYGAVESRDEAKACAALFRKHRDRIAGVIVTLPNFGDERGVAETLRLAGLNVPVLVHAAADDPKQMLIANRRDAFCGKMSVCNVLTQYGIPYSLTTVHTVAPGAESFRKDLRAFAGVCR
ncbi:MAG TPA: hypothetical protein VNE60_10080, partial [Gemmatimonadaceae bacterium]|nr:hypothetical protein [Gemmatimonadaceae bacterium]